MTAFEKSRYIFEERDTGEVERIVASAIRMGEIVFENKHVLHPKHINEFLRVVQCKITEAVPKHKKRTQYCSIEAFLNPMPENLEPVSYTHLDVYKRQIR